MYEHEIIQKLPSGISISTVTKHALHMSLSKVQYQQCTPMALAINNPP